MIFVSYKLTKIQNSFFVYPVSKAALVTVGTAIKVAWWKKLQNYSLIVTLASTVLFFKMLNKVPIHMCRKNLLLGRPLIKNIESLPWSTFCEDFCFFDNH